MAWYHYHQNNSGGGVVQTDALDWNVWIEAASASEANARAQEIGIYFDGCDTGYDCPCCGDRWYAQWQDSDGTDKPMLYDTKITRRKGSKVLSGLGAGLYNGTTLHLYHKNGTHDRIYTADGKVTGHDRS